MTTDVMIQASQLTKRFGRTRALDKVSFEVTKGEVVGFLGPNGAGKSTTMRILTCFLAPTSGTAKVAGVDVFEDPLAVRKAIGYLPQRAPLYTDMGVSEYLRFVAEIRGVSKSAFKKSMDRIIDVCGLAQVLNKDIGTLSHGYRQRVGLGQALLHDPRILILDEPTADLDPNEKAELISYIKEIGKDRTILLSTHNLPEAEEACSRAIVVSKGRVVADGSIEDIRSPDGLIRYQVVVEKAPLKEGGDAPSADKVESALKAIETVETIESIDSKKETFGFELAAPKDGDLSGEIARLAESSGWAVVGLKRELLSLETVFRDLTSDDEARDRGRDLEEDGDDSSDPDVDEALADSDESEKESA